MMLTLFAENAMAVQEALTAFTLIIAILSILVTLTTSIFFLRTARSNSSLRKEVAHGRALLEQERALREQEEQAHFMKLSEAKRIEDLADVYRQRLRDDETMSKLKILTMDWPLDLISVYVQLVLHHQTRSRFINDELLKAQSIGDPNRLLRASLLQLESRANAAIPPDEAIRIYKHCVIVGNPGAGKTTLLKYLALRSAARQLSGLSDVPIHIDLNIFANSGAQDLLTFAAAKWDKIYGFPTEDARSYMEKNLQAGNALLLLDGLDETLTGTSLAMAEKAYKRITHLISQMASTYPQAFIVVTSRIAGYQQRAPLLGFNELEVLDFRPADIECFINNWFMYHPQGPKPKAALKLKEQLRLFPRIQSLISNPLLLALVVLVSEQPGGLPASHSRSALYAQCVDTFLSWDSDHGHPQERERFHLLKKHETKKLLINVAWKFHNSQQRFFARRDLLHVIDDFVSVERIDERVIQTQKLQLSEPAAAKILDENAVETGLLKEYATELYGFLHLTLQEYFASLAIDQVDDRFPLLLDHIGEPWWEEVLLLYAGSTDRQDRLLEKLLQYQDHHTTLFTTLFHAHLILAGRCLAAHPTKTQHWQKIVSNLFRLLHEPYSLTRQQAAQALAELGDEETNEQLLHMVSDEFLDVEIAKNIVDAFGLFCSNDVAEVLVNYIVNTALDSTLRMHIVVTLGKSAIHFIMDHLIKYLEDRFLDKEIRISIADTLGKSGEATLNARLLPLLTKPSLERDVEVRCSIVDAIGASGNPSVAPALYALLPPPNTAISSIHWHTIIALANLGHPENISTLLLPLLYDNKGYAVWTRRDMMDAIGTLRLRSLVDELLPLLEKNEIDWSVRVSIAIALGATGDRNIIGTLIEYVCNDRINTYVRISIATILGTLCDNHYIPELRKLPISQDFYPQVYRSIIITRCSIGDKEVVPDLLQWLADHMLDLSEKLNLLDALAILQDSSIIPSLLQMLADTTLPTEIRQSITTLVARLADEPGLIDLVQHHLESSLSTGALTDTIHQALWLVSRRRTTIQAENRSDYAS